MMLGEGLLELHEQAARWRSMVKRVHDPRALAAMTTVLASVEAKIAHIEAEIFREAC